MPKETKFYLTYKQAEAHAYLIDDKDRAILFGGAKGGGKAQSIFSIIHTPKGEKILNDIQVGDEICNADGSISKVTDIYSQGIQKLYKLTFIDGATTLATQEHLWKAHIIGKHIRSRLYTTSQLIEHLLTIKNQKITPNILIPLCAPIEFQKIDVSLNPYLLGLLLGDGCFRGNSPKITITENFLLEEIKKLGYIVSKQSTDDYIISEDIIKKGVQNKLKVKLELLGLWGLKSEDKFIPSVYLYNSIKNRIMLLQGLMDTDGYVDKRGHCIFYSVSEKLAKSVQWIVRSLGGKATITCKAGKYKKNGKIINCKTCYVVYIGLKNKRDIVRLPSKKERAGKKYNNGLGELQRRLLKIEYYGEEEAKCIKIDNPNGLYITDNFIVTHNSFLLCLWVAGWVRYLIKLLQIDSPKYPVALGFIGRKRAVDFNDTTLETFKRTIPPDIYEIKTQDKEIIIDHTAKIAYGGLDDQENINKFNSAEFAFIAIDQAEETIRDDIAILQATLRMKYNGIKPPYKELYTANPAECWLKEDFINKTRPGSIFIPALPDDNPYLPINYKETLRNAFVYDPALLKAYLDGDWDAFASLENVLFKAKWIEQARLKKTEDEEDAIRIVAADVATKHGDCQTVVMYRLGHTFKEIRAEKQIPSTTTANIIKRYYEQKEADTIVIDSDGFGEGVSDILTAQRIGVIEFHGGYGAKALQAGRYRNLRSQFYHIAAKKFENGLYCLNELPQNVYETLKSQLCSIRVRPPDAMGRMQIETKEDMMARGIKSPDFADALVYSEFAFFTGRLADIRAYAYR